MFRCESEHEYQCTNERCIAKYLACDHHNNCGDYSDEHVNCMSRIPTGPSQPDLIPTDGRDSGQIDYWPPSPSKPYQPQQPSSTSQLPTFPIDTDRTHDGGGSFDSDSIPEYFDIPFPGRDKTTHGPTIFHKPKPMNGFHGTEVHTGG
ncbi:low-density lipoprotein receptor-related protein 2-like protein, partial [Euroglyphus maynei]